MEEGILGRLRRAPAGADVTHFVWPQVYLEFGGARAPARVRYRICGEGG